MRPDFARVSERHRRPEDARPNGVQTRLQTGGAGAAEGRPFLTLGNQRRCLKPVPATGQGGRPRPDPARKSGGTAQGRLPCWASAPSVWDRRCCTPEPGGRLRPGLYVSGL